MKPWSPFLGGLCGVAKHSKAPKQPAFLPVWILPHTDSQLLGKVYTSSWVTFTLCKWDREQELLCHEGMKKIIKNKLKNEKNSTDKNACHSMNSVVCGCYHAYNCCCDSNSPLALCISDNCISGSENMYNWPSISMGFGSKDSTMGQKNIQKKIPQNHIYQTYTDSSSCH